MASACELNQEDDPIGPSNDTPPSLEELKAVEDIPVFDSKGVERPFKSLYSGPGSSGRVLVVFVRHFLCSTSSNYVKFLSEEASPEKIAPSNTSIVIIGNGVSGVINMYIENTGCKHPVYVEPTGKLFEGLGMIKTWVGGPATNYASDSNTSSFFQAASKLVRGLLAGYPATKVGQPNQQGGEFLFEGSEEARMVTCYSLENKTFPMLFSFHISHSASLLGRPSTVTMIPPQLLGAYRQYKQDTDSVASWLASTAIARGYPADLLATSLSTPAPKTSGRLKGKARTKARSGGASNPKPTNEKRRIIAIKDFVPLANFIAGRRVSVPDVFSTTIDRLIALRSGFGGKLGETGAKPDPESDEKHGYFVGILEAVREALRPRMAPTTAAVALDAVIEASKDTSRDPTQDLGDHLVSQNEQASLQDTNSSRETTIMSPVRELDLIDKVAVISGASRGIGRAIAFNLASRGCSILGTCTSDEGVTALSSGLDEEITTRVFEATARERPVSLTIKGLIADIFSEDCASVIANEINKTFNNRIDIFINCASDPMPGVIGEMEITEVQRSLVGNIRTPVMIVEEFVRRRYFQPNSRIIYISSIRSRQPWSDQLMYAAGKSAGESLCRTWAQAFGGKDERYSFMDGTTANAVTAGLTETDAVVDCGPEAVKRFQDEFFPTQSIPRFGQPEDVADVVGLLCGNDARWITGCVAASAPSCVMVDYSPNIIASFCITFPIATLVVILRLISKRMTTTGYGLEDILAVFCLGYCIDVLIWLADYGLGRPIEQGLSSHLSLDEKIKVSWLILWCSSILYSFTIAFCKFSILCFYWRLFKYSSVRIPVQVLSGLTLAWFILRLFLVTLQCIPIRGLWDHSVKHTCGVNETVFFFATVLTHVLIDCAILALPIIEVGKMHLPKGQKIAVIALFMFGGL
ncbi:hypothetical protein MRS44_011375 [Fusarium solani]|uniref:uncharacterized protein n=1 Tax=Fusarium solani TaxID=169388 RepID=UPI0032C4997A|nr:hypothetical protein MRS44_011375 [Fusarium solani]